MFCCLFQIFVDLAVDGAVLCVLVGGDERIRVGSNLMLFVAAVCDGTNAAQVPGDRAQDAEPDARGTQRVPQVRIIGHLALL